MSKRILTEGSTRNKVYRNKGKVPNIPYPPPPPRSYSGESGRGSNIPYPPPPPAPQPKSPWIPVSERLPEPYKKVLIWSTISIEPDYGCLMGDEWATFETHGILFGKDRKGKITHWMPLPPPPE